VSTPSSRPGEWPGVVPLRGAELLERAVGYTRGSLELVAGADLGAPTPCAGWDLRALLRHMNDSLAAFTEAAEIGYVDLVPVRTDAEGDALVRRLQGRACALVGAWSRLEALLAGRPVTVADRELPRDLLAGAGALEIAVHGWDVAQACGVDRPLPAALSLELLDVARATVLDEDRPTRFADPVDVPLYARPGTRLLALLGREAPDVRR